MISNQTLFLTIRCLEVWRLGVGVVDGGWADLGQWGHLSFPGRCSEFNPCGSRKHARVHHGPLTKSSHSTLCLVFQTDTLFPSVSVAKWLSSRRSKQQYHLKVRDSHSLTSASVSQTDTNTVAFSQSHLDVDLVHSVILCVYFHQKIFTHTGFCFQIACQERVTEPVSS